MNLLDIFKKPQNSANHNYVGAPSFSLVNPAYMNHYSSEEYASAYPSIRAISNEYMVVLPKAIDSNGKPIQNNPILNALYHPNRSDSVVAFNEKIAVSTLVNRMTYILVWRNENGEAKPGGPYGFKGSRIAGFTFLENPGITRRDGQTYYNIGSQEFTENEVLVLPGGVNPHDLYGGYSPTDAAVRWITLDDYIADFQKGFFDNNAIPAGMFKITAATPQEFTDIKNMLQDRHKGAGKNNNVTYAHSPIDPQTGKPAQAQIEWVPFQQSNKDIDFKSLFEQANHRIDISYGVAQIIKGVDDAATYANAQVAERGFAKRAVLPLLTRNYTQLTHELNRITGGIGIALTFDYEIPDVADEKEVEARTAVLHTNLITNLTAQGYTLGSIIDAYDLPKRLKLLSTTEKKETIENDKAEVDEGDEVDSAPDREKIDGVTPVNKVKAELSETDKDTYEQVLAYTVREYMEKQVNEAVTALDTVDAVTGAFLDDFTDEMMRTVILAMVASGNLQYQEGIALLVESGLGIEGITSFTLQPTQEEAYRSYLRNVAKSYTDDTAESIRRVLARGNEQGLTKNELQAALKNIMITDEERVTRLAVSEINRSQQMSSLYSMQQIETEVEAKIYKVWNVSNAERCEYCQAMDGKRVPLNEAFVKKGDVIVGVDGGVYVNDFVSMDTPQAHPYCMCYFTWEVER